MPPGSLSSLYPHLPPSPDQPVLSHHTCVANRILQKYQPHPLLFVCDGGVGVGPEGDVRNYQPINQSTNQPSLIIFSSLFIEAGPLSLAQSSLVWPFSLDSMLWVIPGETNLVLRLLWQLRILKLNYSSVSQSPSRFELTAVVSTLSPLHIFTMLLWLARNCLVVQPWLG